MKLSIIIPVLNEYAECQRTIASIRATTNAGDVEVIVVDDGSQVPLTLEDGEARLIRNPDRAGAGAARHIGAIAATAEYLLFVDAHCRFEPGWLERALARITGRRKTVHCATCVALSESDGKDKDARDSGGLDFNQFPNYYGARLNFYGPDPGKPGSGVMQVLEGNWAADQPGDDYGLSCLMGACYFWPRQWFLHLGGLRVLRGWGSEEPLSALKSWLAGGDVLMLKSVRVGHIFREAGPYRTPSWQPIYNKLAILHTCLPEAEGGRLEARLRAQGPATEYSLARQAIEANANEILVERAWNQRLFVRSLAWYLSRFQLVCP